MTANFGLEEELSWARTQMMRVCRALDDLPELAGVRLACSIHLDLKMAPLLEGLLAKGAHLFVTTCNPDTVRDEVAEHLQSAGANVEAWRGMPQDASRTPVERALDWGPTHLCEMGAELTAALCQRESRARRVAASLEATGSGIARLAGLPLAYPIFNWDDLPVKEGLHNRWMVGLTTWHTFYERTLLTLHEKRVLVVGYGSVGRGLADAARAYGGTVCVVERDPARALEARYAGLEVSTLEAMLPEAEVIVTATGARSVLNAGHFPLLRGGVFLLNVGHRPDEIDVAALRGYPSREVLPFVEAIDLGDRTVYLLAGRGDSLNAFDLTLALLTAGIGHIVGAGAREPAGVHILPRSVWEPYIRSGGQ